MLSKVGIVTITEPMFGIDDVMNLKVKSITERYEIILQYNIFYSNIHYILSLITIIY